MARVTVIVVGPSRGAGCLPRIWAGEAHTVRDVAAGTPPEKAGSQADCGRPVCFVNARDARFVGGEDAELGDGDVVMLVHSATDL